MDQLLAPLPDYNWDVWAVWLLVLNLLYRLVKALCQRLCCKGKESEELVSATIPNKSIKQKWD